MAKAYNESFLNNIIANSLDAIVVSNEKGIITRVNQALLDMVGYDEEEMVGENTGILGMVEEGEYESVLGEKITITSETINGFRDKIAELFETGKILNWETYCLRKDKKLVPAEENIVLLYNNDKALIGSVGFLRDISRRKKAEAELLHHRDHLNDLVKDKTCELSAANEQLMAANEQLVAGEKALRESEERFRTVVESASEAIMIVDFQQKIIFWNDGAKKIYGYESDEIIGKSATILIPKRINELRATNSHSNIAIHSSKAVEGHGLRKDGTEFDLAFTVSPWEIEGEIFFTFIGRNISEFKKTEKTLKQLNEQLQAREQELKATNQQLLAGNQQLQDSEKALRKSEKQYRLLVETMNEGLIIRDSKGLLSYVNDRFCEMVGFDKEDLIGQSVENFLDEENKKILLDEIEKRKKGYSEKYEIALRKKSGENLNYIVSPKPVFDKKGKFTESFAVITDISELKRAEQETRETRDFLENIFMTTADGLIVSDSQGLIVRVNSAMEEMLGFEEEELVGRNTLDLLPQDERYLKISTEMIEQLYEKGAVKDFKTMWYRKDGSLCPVEFNLTFLKDTAGNRTGAVGSVHDISERKKIEGQLLQSEKFKSLGELAGGVAHDFNNILAAILGRAQLLTRLLDLPEEKQEKKKIIDELKKGLETIEKAALDGSETVRRVQEFSRKREDDKYFDIIDLKNVVDGALEFTKIRWKNDAESKGVVYTFKVDLPRGSYVKGSASELREVFTNLINNALDAMPQGGEISIELFLKSNNFVLKIIDSGIGIPQSIRDRIFDPFFTTKGPQSTGLGMSVSFGIISRHNGTISVDSVEAEGTVFTVILPVVEKKEEEVKEPESVALQQKASILVIEDEKEVRLLLADLLLSEGHTVETASDGKAGIALFKNNEFDMVFTDLGMPGMSGWQVAEEIKKIDPNMPVVLVTGWEVMHKEEEIKKSGVDMVILKPFKLSRIARVIKESLDLRKQNS